MATIPETTPSARRWLVVAALVLIIGVPVALAGLYGSGDLCGTSFESGNKQFYFDGHENEIETLVVRCTGTYPGGTDFEETRINWLGGGAALFFLVATFFASAAVVSVLPRKRAALAAGTCVLGCLALTAIWFA